MSKRTVDRLHALVAFVCPQLFLRSNMHYMKLLGLEMMVFAIGATVLFGQGNQEAANLTREGIEASRRTIGTKRLPLLKSSAAGREIRSKSGFGFAAARHCLCESGKFQGSDYRLFRGAKSESKGSRYF